MPIRLRAWFFLLFACCFWGVCLATRAQSGVQPITVTVYEIGGNDHEHLISDSTLKQYGFSNTSQDPAVLEELLKIVSQGKRAEISHVPAINAHIRIERSDTGEAYDVSPRGVTWSGGHCYQLSRQDQAALSDALQQDFFTADFWKDHVTQPVRVGNGWGRPTLGTEVDASQLRSNMISLAYTVDQDGRTQNIEVLVSSGIADLDAEVVQLTKTSRYVPGTQDGKPKWFRLVHTFNL